MFIEPTTHRKNNYLMSKLKKAGRALAKDISARLEDWLAELAVEISKGAGSGEGKKRGRPAKKKKKGRPAKKKLGRPAKKTAGRPATKKKRGRPAKKKKVGRPAKKKVGRPAKKKKVGRPAKKKVGRPAKKKAASKTSKTKRVSNLEKVKAAVGVKGATVKEISGKTGIQPPNISTLLKKHSDIFRKSGKRGGVVTLKK